jgi:hypothetical protein
VKHLNPELEKLESRVAPTLLPILDCLLGGGDCSNSQDSCSNSNGSGSHGSQSSGSNGSGSSCS